MTEKVLGYLLLTIGLMVIVFAAFSAYQVMTKQAQPVPLFNFPGISIDMSQALSASLPEQLRQMVSQAGPNRQEIISRDMVNIPLNIFSHLMLMGFIATIGSKIGGLGVQLIRPIEVKLNEKK